MGKDSRIVPVARSLLWDAWLGSFIRVYYRSYIFSQVAHFRVREVTFPTIWRVYQYPET